MNKQKLIEALEELKENAKRSMEISKYKDFWQGKTEAYVNTVGLAKQLDEPQKPVIQQFVADLVDWTNKMQCAPSDVIRDLHDNGDLANLPRDLELDKLSEYFEKAYCRYDFEKACFVGYEVEKEPLYYVILSENTGGWKYTFLDEEGSIDRTNNKAHIPTFTEKKVKAIDERYWAFAVPVEEVVER
ncbi:DUF1642 domain-containing protein [Enterococcus faecium]|uniref:DUF1642 domain-containing protein n=1 Tax=Enterococcus faecium TaxID=1352 RepID=UPI00288CAF12|nr:DUF1642 domain-containing protein [Enterococcus faecium]MDT2361075.1 DUF1642 domain-containing protein [Enterococcus faecium]